MKSLRNLFCLLVMVGGPAVAAGQHVTTIPEGVQRADPRGLRAMQQVPCEVEIRYDDGTDDLVGLGSTLGGPPGFNQRLGIIAEAPAGAPGTLWQVYGVRFFSEFWVTPGNLDIVVTSISNPTNTTTQTVFVNAGGTWEFSLSSPLVVGPGEEFSVMLCAVGTTWGVTGEDTSSPDGRSYWSQTACTPESSDFGSPPRDLMIWVCARAAAPPEPPVPTLGGAGLAVLCLLLAGLGATWVFGRRSV